MPAVPLDLGTRSNPARYGHEGAARLVNLYAEPLGREGKTTTALYRCNGFTDFATLTGGGGIRAALALSDADLYVVAGRVLFRVDQLGSNSILGGIPSDGIVTMARNRAAVPQIAIVCDGKYHVVQAGVLTEIADPDLPPPVAVTAIGGIFVFFLSDGRFFWSGIDGIDVDVLSFATAEANADGGVMATVRGQDLVLFGGKSTEFWQLVGSGTEAFSRTTSRDIGCLAAGSVANLEQTIYWIADDFTVRRLNGYDGEVVSTPAVARQIEAEADHAAITSCAWQSGGHSWYSISGSTWTWQYNASTGSWIERKSKDLEHWKITTATRLGSDIILGDHLVGKLYTMSIDAHDEAGDEMLAFVQPPPVTSFPTRARHNRLDIDMVPGRGAVSAVSNVANPSVMIDYSDDGGETWSTQRLRATGAAGQSLRRVYATRLGMSRSRTYRIGVSDPVPLGILSAILNVDGLAR